jgi:uncharacterized membrane protein
MLQLTKATLQAGGSNMKMTKYAIYLFAFLLYAATLVIFIKVIDWHHFLFHVIGSWGVLAIISAIIAKYKNRSCVGWFILTLFIGPASLLLLFIFPKLKKANADIQ